MSDSLFLMPDGWRLSAAALVSALWLVATCVVVVLGLRARVQAGTARAERDALAALLASDPEGRLLIGRDGTLWASPAACDGLGLTQMPQSLADLTGAGRGLSLASVETLGGAVQNALILGQTTEVSLTFAARPGRVAQATVSPACARLADGEAALVRVRDVSAAVAQTHALESVGEDLRKDLQSLQAFVEALPVPVWRRTIAGELDLVNGAYVRAVGAREGGQVLSQQRLLSPRPTRTLGSDQQWLWEDTAIIGGERRRLQCLESALPEGLACGVALDVTERDVARAETARMAQAQTETLNRLSAGVAVFGADKKLLFCNQSFIHLFDLADADMASGVSFGDVIDLMRARRRLPEARDYRAWKRARTDWFTGLLEPEEETWTLALGLTLRVMAQPHPLGGLLFVFEDQTEQLSLASSRDTLVKVQATTLNNLHEAVALFGANGRLRLHNSRFGALWGLTEARLSGEPDVTILGAATAPYLAGRTVNVQWLAELVRQAAHERAEARRRLAFKDGRTVEAVAAPLPDGGALLTFLDVSAAVSLESALRARAEALEAADKLKSRFVETMSAELRTPLTAILGYGEMLEQGYLGALSEPQSRGVNRVLVASKRLQLLISDILDLAVLEAGRLELEREEVALPALVAEVVDLIDEQAKSAEVALEVTAAPDVAAVLGDPRRLKQVLYNLLSNSVRTVGTGGRVMVRISSGRTRVRVAVLESRRVLSRETGDSPDGPIGLQLVTQIMALHGGAVTAAPLPDGGAAVTLEWPRLALSGMESVEAAVHGAA